MAESTTVDATTQEIALEKTLPKDTAIEEANQKERSLDSDCSDKTFKPTPHNGLPKRSDDNEQHPNFPKSQEKSHLLESASIEIASKPSTIKRFGNSTIQNEEKKVSANQKVDVDPLMSPDSRGSTQSLLSPRGTPRKPSAPVETTLKDYFQFLGEDSQGTKYWFDGEKCLYSKKPLLIEDSSNNKVTLICKSYRQWTFKCKELSTSTSDVDAALLQHLKNKCMPLVKKATSQKEKRGLIKSPRQSDDAVSVASSSVSSVTEAKPKPLTTSASMSTPTSILQNSLPTQPYYMMVQTPMGPQMVLSTNPMLASQMSANALLPMVSPLPVPKQQPKSLPSADQISSEKAKSKQQHVRKADSQKKAKSIKTDAKNNDSNDIPKNNKPSVEDVPDKNKVAPPHTLSPHSKPSEASTLPSGSPNVSSSITPINKSAPMSYPLPSQYYYPNMPFNVHTDPKSGQSYFVPPNQGIVLLKLQDGRMVQVPMSMMPQEALPKTSSTVPVLKQQKHPNPVIGSSAENVHNLTISTTPAKGAADLKVVAPMLSQPIDTAGGKCDEVAPGAAVQPISAPQSYTVKAAQEAGDSLNVSPSAITQETNPAFSLNSKENQHPKSKDFLTKSKCDDEAIQSHDTLPDLSLQSDGKVTADSKQSSSQTTPEKEPQPRTQLKKGGLHRRRKPHPVKSHSPSPDIVIQEIRRNTAPSPHGLISEKRTSLSSDPVLQIPDTNKISSLAPTKSTPKVLQSSNHEELSTKKKEAAPTPKVDENISTCMNSEPPKKPLKKLKEDKSSVTKVSKKSKLPSKRANRRESKVGVRTVQELLIKIPRKLLSSRDESSSEDEANAVSADETPEDEKRKKGEGVLPLDEVDLLTLTEITGNKELANLYDKPRAKRRCVAIREEIAKLQKILGEDESLLQVEGRMTRSKSTVRTPQKKNSLSSAKEEEKSHNSSDSEEKDVEVPPNTIHIFTSKMANLAAKAVSDKQFKSIIPWHASQTFVGVYLKAEVSSSAARRGSIASKYRRRGQRRKQLAAKRVKRKNDLSSDEKESSSEEEEGETKPQMTPKEFRKKQLSPKSAFRYGAKQLLLAAEIAHSSKSDDLEECDKDDYENDSARESESDMPYNVKPSLPRSADNLESPPLTSPTLQESPLISPTLQSPRLKSMTTKSSSPAVSVSGTDDPAKGSLVDTTTSSKPPNSQNQAPVPQHLQPGKVAVTQGSMWAPIQAPTSYPAPPQMYPASHITSNPMQVEGQQSSQGAFPMIRPQSALNQSQMTYTSSATRNPFLPMPQFYPSPYCTPNFPQIPYRQEQNISMLPYGAHHFQSYSDPSWLQSGQAARLRIQSSLIHNQPTISPSFLAPKRMPSVESTGAQQVNPEKGSITSKQQSSLPTALLEETHKSAPNF